jgi:hypothetical protein
MRYDHCDSHLVSSRPKELLDQCVYSGLLAGARRSVEEEVGQVLAVCQSAQTFGELVVIREVRQRLGAMLVHE